MLQVEVPAGFTHTRLLGGVPLALALALGVFPIATGILTASFLYALLCLPISTLLWSFAAYRTKRDPQWLTIWIAHLRLKAYYYAS